MSNSRHCQAHILNILTQQLAARKTIEEYSQRLCHLLALRCTIRDRYQEVVLEKLLHVIIITLESVSEAYNLIDELGTASVQDLLQTHQTNLDGIDKLASDVEDEFEELPELVD
ncbi:hypothetical protein PILCRDRAFT_92370 [Piloderma croceum F 1598]|uniref:Uncharacterized protein n=1 Tax=Piloderma croceum (strain F 1598) TaxID=765440 RepID=A0A0C3F493_PILCF|nr:hypothetical protein PILCRDRAFT_92370 [Piloderma croceum F 1598]